MKQNQKGAILVTSLLLLLVLTIIGVSVMQMTRMQERMAGNTREINTAFQGAESALRAGESQIMQYGSRPSFCTASPCTSSFAKDLLPPMNTQTKQYWESMAQEVDNEDLNEEFDIPPQYVSEKLAFIGFSTEFDETQGRDFYQVAARSTGATGNAESVVQSTFARISQ